MTEMMVAMVSKNGIPLEGSDDAQHKAHQSAQRNGHAADLNRDGQAGLDELGDRRIFGDVVAHTQIAPEHIAHVAEELDVDRLVKAVFCIERGSHIGCQLFVVEGRAGHQLHQDEQHQQDGQQRKQRGEDTLERIFFHVR